MRKLSFFLLICLLPFYGSSQHNDLGNEIMEYTDRTAELIIKGRGLLTEKFQEGDMTKVAEIRHYLLTEVKDTNQIVFYPLENWLILYWTDDYSEILSGLDSIMQRDRQRNKVAPPKDQLLKNLISRSRDSLSDLKASIIDADLVPEDRAFLLLHLTYLTQEGGDHEKDETALLNDMSDEFLKQYPDSKYENFIRTYTRYRVVASKWGFAFEFFSGYGIITGDVQQYFGNPVPLGISFDIGYRNWILHLRNYIGISRTLQDIPYSLGYWNKKSQANIYMPEASIGYVLAESQFFKFMPFAGFTGALISPVEADIQKDPDLRKADWKFRSSWTAGLTADIKLGRGGLMLFNNPNEEGYIMLRVRYSYAPMNFDRQYNTHGSIHNFTLGFGAFGRRLMRDY